MGIESTPVIDPGTNTLYFIARTVESAPTPTYVQRLHAIDISTGADKFGGSVEITASVSGSAPDAVGGVVSFNPELQNQRSSLALVNGVVLAGWSAHEDIGPWHGWIMGFNAANLSKVGAICTTPDGIGGGVWQSGRGPAVDASGYAYYESGNGTWDGTRNFAQSVLKLAVSTAGVALAAPPSSTSYSYYTPGNYAALTNADLDLSSTGAFLVPGTDLLIAGSKASLFYQIHTTSNLGGLDSGNANPSVNVNGQDMKSGPVYWKSASLGGLVYIWAQVDYLKSFRFNGATLASTYYRQGPDASQDAPGGALAISANGSADASAILWALTTTVPNGNNGGDNGVVPGILRAYQATTLTELWTSESDAARDRLGSLNKFVVPVVANGRVYAVTQDNTVAVYGLLASAPTAGFSLAILDRTSSVNAGQSIALRGEVTAVNGDSTPPGISVSGLPSNATATVAAATSQPGYFSMLINTAGSTPPGTYALQLTGTYNSLGASDTVSLTVLAPSALSSAVPVSLNGVANVSALSNDGVAFTNGGFDGFGYAFSANAVGAPLVFGGIPFALGAANAPDAVSALTLPLPAGEFAGLYLLGAGANGNQAGAVFKVNYADGTSSSTTLSLSDWCTPQNYAGETVVRQMAYRNLASGAASYGCPSVNLYAYSLPLTVGKIATSLTLPANANVRILAVSAVRALSDVTVPLQSAANVTGLFTDGSKSSSAGLDNEGYSYSATLLGSSQTWGGHQFALGAANALDAISNATVALPANRAGSLRLLATAVNGNQVGQVFKVTYTDGTSASLTQSLSDWCHPQGYAGEAVVAVTAHRDLGNGTTVACGANTTALYGYALALDPGRTPATLTLPANRNVVVLAVTLSPPEFATPVMLGSAANVEGINTDGSTPLSGGLDAAGYSYSASALPANLNWAGVPFALNLGDSLNAAASGAVISLPAGSFSGLRLLATAVNGNQTGQAFTVTYTDGTTTTLTQSLSDWCGPQGYAGETVVARTFYRVDNGAPVFDCAYEAVYGYLIPLDASRTPKSLTLPANRDVVVLGASVQ